MRVRAKRTVGIGAMAAVMLLPFATSAQADASLESSANTQRSVQSIPEGFTSTDGMTIVRTEPVAQTLENVAPKGEQRANFKWYEVRNADYAGQLCGSNKIGEVTGSGPITLTLTKTETVSRAWSATVEVAASAVSAGVGFEVTAEESLTMSGRWNVPSGEFGHLVAYPLYDNYTFDVTNAGIPAGSGSAQNPVGYCYNHWTN